MRTGKDITWRFGVIYISILMFALLIYGKVLYLQIFEHDKWINKANSLTFKDITLEPNRGDICGDDGRLLASSLPTYEIRMDMKSPAMTDKIFSENVDSLALCLSNLFGDKSKETYKLELIDARQQGNRAYLIQKEVNYLQLKKVKKFPIFRLGRYKGGVRYFQHNKRKHPYNDIALRTIGRTKNESEDRTIIGIEGAYNNQLKGKKGIRLMQKGADGIWMPIHEQNEIEPEDGNDVITTIDVDFQEIVHNALLERLKYHNAHHGTVVLMKVQTGEIKAIANLQKDKDGQYRELYNFAVGESTEPGSTFKLASLIAAFEDGYINLNTPVNTGGGMIKYYNFPITDTKRGGWRRITVQKAFEVSSNVGISKIIFDHYANNPRKFIDRLYSMGLNEKLNIEIKGEGEPYIKYPGDKLWSRISLPQMSIGYEVHITPLQTLTLYNAIANNGIMVQPKFVKELRFHGNTVKKIDTEILNNAICSHETLRRVKQMLEGVVIRGTATNLKDCDFKIAGKTGTAKIYDREQNRYVMRYKASFVGYFPAEKPQYSCIVYVYNPQQYGYYGSSVAAPVFKEIAKKIYIYDVDIHKPINTGKKLLAGIPFSKSGFKNDLEYVLKDLGIPRLNSKEAETTWIQTTRQKNGVAYHSRSIKNNIVPAVTGMGARDALYLLEKAGLTVVMKGRGMVVKQSITAGSKFKRGDKIVIELG